MPDRYVQSTWRDPDDDDPNRRTPKLVHGVRRYDVLQSMHRANDSEITIEHMKAVGRWVTAYEVGVEGASPGSGRMEYIDDSSRPDISQKRMDLHREWREVKAALGERNCEVLIWVVFGNWPISRVAQACKVNDHRAKERVIGALCRLHEIYNPSPPAAVVRDLIDIDTLRQGRFNREG